MEKILLCFTIILTSTVIVTLGVRTAYPYGPIKGVNLGSWLVLEKWMAPIPFSGYDNSQTVIDEWTFCHALGPVEAAARLKLHRDSWVTETDIKNLSDAGINHLRLPIGYWAFTIPGGEPWVNGSLDYIIQALTWAKQYNMHVMIDLHGAPGGQSTSQDTGRANADTFFYSPANMTLATEVMVKLAKIINDPQWQGVATIIELLNEPNVFGNGTSTDYTYRLNTLKRWYNQTYLAVRQVNPTVTVAFHDAFIGYSNWYYLANASYTGALLDTHLYQAYAPYTSCTCDQHAAYPCAKQQNLTAVNKIVPTVVGEWSLATSHTPTCTNEQTFGTQQLGVYGNSANSAGYIFWSMKHYRNESQWDFFKSTKNNWINVQAQHHVICPPNPSNTFTCG